MASQGEYKIDMKKLISELPGMGEKRIPERKITYGKKLKGLLDEYDQCLIVTVDNVGSKQIAELRKDYRGKARFLFGKNTMIRKVIREYIKETGNRKLMALLDLCTGNSGFIFTKMDVKQIRNEIEARKKQCSARAGAIAPVDVTVPAGPTGMEPTATSFFQAMDIPTRINRGQIDITDDVQIVFKGTKVGPSEASLLVKLGIKPFYYGIKVASVYVDGDAFAASVLDLTEDDLACMFYAGLRQVASLSFEMNYPTILNVPHAVVNVYKKMLALGLGFGKYSWENLAHVKEVLANPEAFANVGGGGGGAAAGGAAAAAAEPEVEEEEESSEKVGNMFGDDSSSSDDDDDDDDDSS